MKQFSLLVSIGTLSILGALSSFSYAQSSDAIFKCVDAQGNVSYVNVNSAKSSTCSKTDLATIDKLSVVALEHNKRIRSEVNRSSSSTANSSGSGMVVKDEDQQIRETKRIVVLKRELTDEQEQLNTVNSMLTNVASKDPAQAGQLKEMQATHQKNIESLQKELGMKTQTTSITPNPLAIVNTSNVNNTSNSGEDEHPNVNNVKHEKKKKIINNVINNVESKPKKTDLAIITSSNNSNVINNSSVTPNINSNFNETKSLDKTKSNFKFSNLPIVKKFVPPDVTITHNTSPNVSTNIDPAKFLLNK